MTTGELPVYDQTDHGIRILEEERRRIARDLHDGPAQALTNISMRLDIILRMLDDNPEMARSQISQLNSRIVATVNEIRHLIYDLRPIAIDEVGLVQAMKELCNRCEKDWHFPVVMTVADELSCDGIAPAKQVAIYRLIQEILNNIKKHAQAKRVHVSLSRSDNRLLLVIQDDGKGFDPNVIPVGHYGLIGMKERAAYLGGVLDIDSVIGEGSRFTIIIPVYLEDTDGLG